MNIDKYESFLLKTRKIGLFVAKHKVAIISGAVVVAVGGGTAIGLNGAVINESEIPSNFVYGDVEALSELSCGAIFGGDTHYVFANKGEDNWSEDIPTNVGEYQAKAVSKNTFGGDYNGKIHYFTISPFEVTASFKATDLVYGNELSLSDLEANILPTDEIVSYTLSYEKSLVFTISETKQENKAKIASLTIKNKTTNEDVSQNYVISNSAWKDVSIDRRLLSLVIDGKTTTYDGSEVSNNVYSIKEGSLAEGDLIEISAPQLFRYAGSYANSRSITIKNSENVDVTQNYNISVDVNNILIEKRALNLSTPTVEKVYDGHPFKDVEYKANLSTFNLASGDEISIDYINKDKYLANIAGYENSVEYSIMRGEENAKPSYDDSNSNIGRLVIKPRSISLTNILFEDFVFDSSTNKYLIVDGSKYIKEGILAETDSISFVANKPVDDSPFVYNAVITHQNGTDVTNCYEIESEGSGFEVTKRNITIKTNSLEKVYDGKTFDDSEFRWISEGDNFVHSVELSFKNESQWKPCDDLVNSVDLTLKDNKGVIINAEDYYNITFDYGTLNIVKKDLVVTGKGYEAEYNGSDYKTSDNDFELSSDIAATDSIEVTYLNTFGISDLDQTKLNEFSVKIMHGDEDVTESCYNITKIENNVSVSKIKIEVFREDETYEYDGLAHDAHYEVEESKLLEGHTYSVDLNGVTITEVGSYKGSVVLTIKDAESLDVSSSIYNIVYNDATITVTKRVITLTVTDAYFDYDGEAHDYKSCEIIGKWLDFVPTITWPTLTNAGSIDNIPTIVVLNAGGDDVTKFFDFSASSYGKLTINKVSVEKPAADENSPYVYTGSEIVYRIDANPLYLISDRAMTLAGTKDIVVSLVDKDNYYWGNNESDTEDLVYHFEIVKDQVSIPEADATVFAYDGTLKTYGISSNSFYTVSGNEQTSAGSYVVTASLTNPSNITWNDGSTTDKTYEFVINKKEIETPVYTDTYVYNGTSNIIDIPSSDDYSIYIPDHITAGEYDAILTLNDADNTCWQDSEENHIALHFTISKFDLTIGLDIENHEYIYNGEVYSNDEYTLSYDISTFGDVFTLNGFASKKYVSYSNNEIEQVGNNYTWTIKCDDNDRLNCYNITVVDINNSETILTPNKSGSITNGSIKITPRNVNFTVLTDGEGVRNYEYNGDYQTNVDLNYEIGYVSSNTGLIDSIGDYYFVKSYTQARDYKVDGYENNIEIQFLNSDDVDITDSYNVIPFNSDGEGFGKIFIEKKDVEFIGEAYSTRYTGSEVKYDVILPYSLCGSGETAKFTFASYTEIGIYSNDFEVSIFRGNVDITENYNINKVSKTIEISLAPIYVTLSAPAYTYSGSEMSFGAVGSELFNGTSVENVYLDVDSSVDISNVSFFISSAAKFTNSGTYNAYEKGFRISAFAKDDLLHEHDLIDGYSVVYNGSIIVNKKQIYITTESYDGYFDGQIHNLLNFEFESGYSLCNSDSISIKAIDPANFDQVELRNVILNLDGTAKVSKVDLEKYYLYLNNDIKATSTNGIDFSFDNYVVSVNWGSIRIKPIEVVLESESYIGEYDGIEHGGFPTIESVSSGSGVFTRDYLSELLKFDELTAKVSTNICDFDVVYTPYIDGEKGTNNFRFDMSSFGKIKITAKHIAKPTADPLGISYVYNHGEAITYQIDTNPFYTISGDSLTQISAGNYQIKVNLNNPNVVWDDDSTDELTYSFVINKYSLAIPGKEVSSIHHFYDKNVVNVYAHSTSPYYEVSGYEALEVGNYQTKYVLLDKDNYCWSNSSTDDVVYDWVVEKREIDKPGENTSTFVYTGENITYSLYHNDDYYSISNDVQKDAGTYSITITLLDTDNTKWSDGDVNASFTYTFVINKQEVITPSKDTREFVYNGQEQTYSITPSDLYSVSGNKEIHANETGYIVIISLNDKANYKWNGSDSSDLSYTFVIKRRDITITWDGASKVYDRTALSCDTYSETGLLNGDNIEILTSASITDVGTVANNHSISILNGLVDVTENYNIISIFGNLVISPIEITVRTADYSFIYDGLEHSGQSLNITDIDISSGASLLSGDYLGYVAGGVSNSIIDVGTVANNYSNGICVYNSNGEVCSYYNITSEPGTITVLPKPVTLTYEVYSGLYDGEFHGGYPSVEGLVSGQKIVFNEAEVKINIGSFNVDYTYSFALENDTPIMSKNYSVTVVYVDETSGDIINSRPEKLLNIDKYRYNITPVSGEFVFDNEYHGGFGTSNKFDLVNGDYILIEESAKTWKNVCSNQDNTYSFKVYDSTNSVFTNFSEYYDIYQDAATVTITHRVVSVKTADYECVYTGENIDSSNYAYFEYNNTDFEFIGDVVLDYTTYCNAGTYYNDLDFAIFDNGVDITINYQFNITRGVIVISKRIVELTTVDATKVFDGSPLSSTGIVDVTNVVDAYLVAGHKFVFVGDGAFITYCGKVSNRLGIRIVDDMLNDYTSNYSLYLDEACTIPNTDYLHFGTLEVTPLDITVNYKENVVEHYSGEYFISNSVENNISKSNAYQNDFVSFTFSSTRLEDDECNFEIKYKYSVNATALEVGTYNYSILSCEYLINGVKQNASNFNLNCNGQGIVEVKPIDVNVIISSINVYEYDYSKPNQICNSLENMLEIEPINGSIIEGDEIYISFSYSLYLDSKENLKKVGTIGNFLYKTEANLSAPSIDFEPYFDSDNIYVFNNASIRVVDSHDKSKTSNYNFTVIYKDLMGVENSDNSAAITIYKNLKYKPAVVLSAQKINAPYGEVYSYLQGETKINPTYYYNKSILPQHYEVVLIGGITNQTKPIDTLNKVYFELRKDGVAVDKSDYDVYYEKDGHYYKFFDNTEECNAFNGLDISKRFFNSNEVIGTTSENDIFGIFKIYTPDIPVITIKQDVIFYFDYVGKPYAPDASNVTFNDELLDSNCYLEFSFEEKTNVGTYDNYYVRYYLYQYAVIGVKDPINDILLSTNDKFYDGEECFENEAKYDFEFSTLDGATIFNPQLVIRPRDIEIRSDSDEKVFDGSSLTKQSYSVQNLISGDFIYVSSTTNHDIAINGAIVNSGNSSNTFETSVEDIKIYRGNKSQDISTWTDVTDQYNIVMLTGSLSINRLDLKIKWKENFEGTYNGISNIFLDKFGSDAFEKVFVVGSTNSPILFDNGSKSLPDGYELRFKVRANADYKGIEYGESTIEMYNIELWKNDVKQPYDNVEIIISSDSYYLTIDGWRNTKTSAIYSFATKIKTNRLNIDVVWSSESYKGTFNGENNAFTKSFTFDTDYILGSTGPLKFKTAGYSLPNGLRLTYSVTNDPIKYKGINAGTSQIFVETFKVERFDGSSYIDISPDNVQFNNTMMLKSDGLKGLSDELSTRFENSIVTDKLKFTISETIADYNSVYDSYSNMFDFINEDYYNPITEKYEEFVLVYEDDYDFPIYLKLTSENQPFSSNFELIYNVRIEGVTKYAGIFNVVLDSFEISNGATVFDNDNFDIKYLRLGADNVGTVMTEDFVKGTVLKSAVIEKAEATISLKSETIIFDGKKHQIPESDINGLFGEDRLSSVVYYSLRDSNDIRQFGSNYYYGTSNGKNQTNYKFGYSFSSVTILDEFGNDVTDNYIFNYGEINELTINYNYIYDPDSLDTIGTITITLGSRVEDSGYIYIPVLSYSCTQQLIDLDFVIETVRYKPTEIGTYYYEDADCLRLKQVSYTDEFGKFYDLTSRFIIFIANPTALVID